MEPSPVPEATPLYVVFGTWIEGRRFAWRQGIAYADVVAVTEAWASRAVAEAVDRRLVLVQAAEPTDEQRVLWLHIAGTARFINQRHGRETEVIQWYTTPAS